MLQTQDLRVGQANEPCIGLTQEKRCQKYMRQLSRRDCTASQ